jgi:hypothetical protein
MKNRNEKPKTWSQKGRCPGCDAGSGSKHKDACTFDYAIERALPTPPPNMTLMEKLHAIEKAKTIYDIHYCRAGIGFLFFYPEKVKTFEMETMEKYPRDWRTGLSVQRYYPTFEEAVDAEYKNL